MDPNSPAYIRRYIEEAVVEDLERKMVFISGPRQVGKTTLAKRLLVGAGLNPEARYLNWDAPADREHVLNETFPAGPGLLVLDEVHKHSRWRQVIKGLYDKRGRELQILVTGSARLDHYRRGGDSLQGRYHFYRLLPLTLGEIGASGQSAVEHLMAHGGFPEPFRLASIRQTRRWSREYRTRLVRDDLRDLENVQELDKIETLALRLPDLVGSPLSINALREDLHVSHQSASRWLAMLENLYLHFRIHPFGAPHIRAIKKAAKHYHFDWTLIKDPGARFENLVACHLLTWCCYQQDHQGRNVELRYFRDVDGREVDFVVTEDGHPLRFIECKTRAERPHPGLRYLLERFDAVDCVQLSLEPGPDLVDKDGIRRCPAHVFLQGF